MIGLVEKLKTVNVNVNFPLFGRSRPLKIRDHDGRDKAGAAPDNLITP